MVLHQDVKLKKHLLTMADPYIHFELHGAVQNVSIGSFLATVLDSFLAHS